MDLLVLSDSDGVVDMTQSSIAARTRIPIDQVMEFLAKLEQPDPESRTQDDEGRRIRRLDSHRSWGWIILNYAKFRGIKSEEQRRESREMAPHQVNQRPGYVYYALDGELVKIGFSKNPWARMAAFKAARPGMRVVATELATLTTELLRHKQFEILHVDGEWFKYAGDLRQHVESLIVANKKNTTTNHTTVVATVATTPASASAYVGTSVVSSLSHEEGSAEGRNQRLHGIPSSLKEVIDFGKTLLPPVSEEICRIFWGYYEGQAKTNPSGDIFWITSSGTIVTNWKAKLPSFRGNEPKSKQKQTPTTKDIESWIKKPK